MKQLEEDIRRVGAEVVNRVTPGNQGLSEAIKHLIMWRNIRDGLTAYPLKTQLDFMEGLIGPQGTNFPNGEKLAQTYVAVNNSTWSQPEVPKQNWIRQMTVSHLLALNLEIPFISGILNRTDWQIAMNNAGAAMSQTAQENNRSEPLYITGQMYRFGSRVDSRELYEALINKGFRPIDFLSTFSTILSRELQLIVVEDLMPQYGYPNGNPFEPLRKLYQAGLIVRGIYCSSFRVDRPQIKQAV